MGSSSSKMDSSIKYEKLPTSEYHDEPKTYPVDEEKYWSGQDYSSIYSYNRTGGHFKSFYTYGFTAPPDNQNGEDAVRVSKPFKSTAKLVAETALIVLCYGFVVFTMPLSLILSLKFVNQFERMIIFRLGRVQDPKGPGAVLVLPCIDSWKRVDMRTKAFNVPPIHAITKDAGIVELGAVVCYAVKDALACVSSVQDFGKVIRTLGHSTLHKLINKKLMADLERDRKIVGEELKGQLNSLTMSWGMEVTSVELSDLKIMKQPEMHAAGVFRTLCQPKVASGILAQLMKGGATMPIISQDDPKPAPILDSTENGSEPNFSLTAFVFMLTSICSEALVKEIGHSYQIVCTGMGEFFMDLRHGSGTVMMGRLPENQTDVTIELQAADLVALLTGQLSPLDGYLSGRINVIGDTKVAMKLKVLSTYMQKNFQP